MCKRQGEMMWPNLLAVKIFWRFSMGTLRHSTLLYTQLNKWKMLPYRRYYQRNWCSFISRWERAWGPPNATTNKNQSKGNKNELFLRYFTVVVYTRSELSDFEDFTVLLSCGTYEWIFVKKAQEQKPWTKEHISNINSLIMKCLKRKIYK